MHIILCVTAAVQTILQTELNLSTSFPPPECTMCCRKYPEIYLLWKRGAKVGQGMAELSIFIVVKSNYAKMEIFIRLDRENKERQTALSSFRDTGIHLYQFLYLSTHQQK